MTNKNRADSRPNSRARSQVRAESQAVDSRSLISGNSSQGRSPANPANKAASRSNCSSSEIRPPVSAGGFLFGLSGDHDHR